MKIKYTILEGHFNEALSVLVWYMDEKQTDRYTNVRGKVRNRLTPASRRFEMVLTKMDSSNQVIKWFIKIKSNSLKN